MKKNKKIIKVAALSMCLSISSIGVAFADMATTQLAPDEIMTTTQAEQPIADEKVIEKQVEIDKYLFGDYKEDIAKKGFTVSTTTVTPDGFVQIGITPFSQDNADYLYGLFGKDMVKVVEEAQATTLDDSKIAETAEVVSVADDAKEEETNNTRNIIIGIVAAAVLGFIAIFTQKKKQVRR